MSEPNLASCAAPATYKLYYYPGAISLATRIVLEEAGATYDLEHVDIPKGAHQTAAYRAIHAQARVPALILEDGEVLTENTAILPFLGKRYGLWPSDPRQEARALEAIGLFASCVHIAYAQFNRPQRFSDDPNCYPSIRAAGRAGFLQHLRELDQALDGRAWYLDDYSVIDPYALVFTIWGIRRRFDVSDLRNLAAHLERMRKRPAVQRAFDAEGIRL